MKVSIKEIDNSTNFFTRDKIDDNVVDSYSKLISDGVEFPPIKVYKDEKTQKFIKISGFHTYHAVLKVNRETIEVEVTDKVSDLDRLAEGMESNSKHGIPLSTKERRKNLERILSFPESWEWSNPIIAKIVGVSDRTVSNVKKSLPSPKISEMDTIKCIRNGKEMVQKKRATQSLPDGKETGLFQQYKTTSQGMLPPPENSIQSAAHPNVFLFNNNDQAPESKEEKEVTLDQRISLLPQLKELQKMCVDCNSGVCCS